MFKSSVTQPCIARDCIEIWCVSALWVAKVAALLNLYASALWAMCR